MTYTSFTPNHQTDQPLASHVSLIHRNLHQEENPLQIAVYCRVSTDLQEQKHSYHLQMSYYTAYIEKQKCWKLYKIFADEGISGTSRKKRTAFNQMISDAMDGKIHYIITKSISRFARNTVDTLHCIRSLKALTPPVGVYFEKENIDTLDSRGELMLTILSALAQDESRSLSDNVRWSIQKKFQSGIDVTNLSSMLGYEFGKNKEWVINENQAHIVRYIYKRYLDGLSHESIAKELMERGYATGRGNLVWRSGSVYRILTNEKYVGDTHLQKTMTKDLFSHYSIPNNGTLPSYYIRNHHPAIIDRATWDAVQAEQKRRSRNSAKRKETAPPHHRYSHKWEFSSKLLCGNCSELLVRRTFRLNVKDQNHSARESGCYVRYPVWRCRIADQPRSLPGCHTESYLEISLKQSFMEYLYKLKHDLVSCMYPSASLDALSSCGIIQEFTEYLHQRETHPTSNLCHTPSTDAAFDQATAAAFYQSPEDPTSLIETLRWFLTEIISLPDLAADGSSFQIWGIAKEAATPFDILPFTDHIFQRVIRRGTVMGDQIIYETKFGLNFIVTGNKRRFRDFYGFRRVKDDGSAKILMRTEDVVDDIVRKVTSVKS